MGAGLADTASLYANRLQSQVDACPEMCPTRHVHVNARLLFYNAASSFWHASPIMMHAPTETDITV